VRVATEQLPGFIFYLGAGSMVLAVIAIIETIGERVEKRQQQKEQDAELRRARREQAWFEVSQIRSVYDHGGQV